MRVFFALDPDAAVRRQLAALARELEPQCGGRITATPNLHMTLAFLGEVADTRLPALCELAAGIQRRPFELTIDRVGAFRRAGIVWAGAHECPAALAELANELQERVAAADYPCDRKPFAAHVTLLRKARAPEPHPFAPIPWRPADFVLLASRPAGGGVRYEPVGRWPLAAAV